MKRRLVGRQQLLYFVGFIELVVPQEPADAMEHALEPIHFAVQPLDCWHTTRKTVSTTEHRESRVVNGESGPVEAGSS
jgi:hypothetical protein